ncbi:MAG: TadE/TadG family type IV pilus assembly protein [Pseudonocardiales bacterium]
MSGSRADDRGSFTLELTIIAPVVLAILGLTAFGGRVAAAHGQVEGAARDAARAASITRVGDPQAAARSAAIAAFAGPTDHGCVGGPTVKLNGAPTPGQTLIATVTCMVDVNLGIPLPNTTVTRSVAAPVDQYTAPR